MERSTQASLTPKMRARLCGRSEGRLRLLRQLFLPLHHLAGEANDHVVLIGLSVNRDGSECGTFDFHSRDPCSYLYYGTSHVLSKDEAKFVFERGCEQLILGSGQMGNVHLSPEAEAYFAKKGCKVLLQPTPEAIGAFNRSHAKKIGLFHVTC